MSHSQAQKDIFSYLEKRRLSGNGDLDVILDSGQTFNVHKFIMQAVSCLINDHPDINSNKVQISDCSPDGFQFFIDFVYREEFTFDDDSALLALRTAQTLKSDFFVKACIQEITRRINRETCLKYYEGATELKCDQLKENVLKYLHKHLDEVLITDQVSVISEKELIGIINHAHTNSYNHAFNIVQFCIEWCRRSRSPNPIVIFQSLNLTNLNLIELQSLLNEQFMKDNENIGVRMLILDEVVKYDEPLSCDENKGDFELIGVPEDCQRLCKILDIGRNETLREEIAIECDLQFDKFTQCVASGDIIYFIGGKESQLFVSYSLAYKIWNVLPLAKSSGWSRAVCVVDGDFFTIGGVLNGDSSSLGDRYSTTEKRWYPLADHPAAICAASACGFAGELYVSGGRGHYGARTDISTYCLEKKSWQSVGEMLTARCCHFTCVSDNKLFIVGDIDAHGPMIEMFDLETRQSTAVLEKYMTRNLWFFNAQVTSTSPGTVCLYDPGTDVIYEVLLCSGCVKTRRVDGLDEKKILHFFLVSP